MKRKHSRKHDQGNALACQCAAYPFPHRMFAGRCDPIKWVQDFFFVGKRECVDCINYNAHQCEVLSGAEPDVHCPALREFVEYHGVTLFGAVRERLHRARNKGVKLAA